MFGEGKGENGRTCAGNEGALEREGEIQRVGV